MNDEAGERRRPDQTHSGGDGRTLSGREILVILTVIALACVGGYFFLLKMIEVSRQEDCFLAQRRNCAPAEPFRR